MKRQPWCSTPINELQLNHSWGSKLNIRRLLVIKVTPLADERTSYELPGGVFYGPVRTLRHIELAASTADASLIILAYYSHKESLIRYSNIQHYYIN